MCEILVVELDVRLMIVVFMWILEKFFDSMSTQSFPLVIFFWSIDQKVCSYYSTVRLVDDNLSDVLKQAR